MVPNTFKRGSISGAQQALRIKNQELNTFLAVASDLKVKGLAEESEDTEDFTNEHHDNSKTDYHSPSKNLEDNVKEEECNDTGFLNHENQSLYKETHNSVGINHMEDSESESLENEEIQLHSVEWIRGSSKDRNGGKPGSLSSMKVTNIGVIVCQKRQ